MFSAIYTSLSTVTKRNLQTNRQIRTEPLHFTKPFVMHMCRGQLTLSSTEGKTLCGLRSCGYVIGAAT